VKFEDKVCILEQAKKLVELGVILDTEKYWVTEASDTIDTTLINRSQIVEADAMGWLNPVPAPDVAELGELLHKNCFVVSYADARTYVYNDERWWDLDLISNDYARDISESILEKATEAQARCQVLIWLIENEYLKPNDIAL
jgi:hypothetical protein